MGADTPTVYRRGVDQPGFETLDARLVSSFDKARLSGDGAGGGDGYGIDLLLPRVGRADRRPRNKHFALSGLRDDLLPGSARPSRHRDRFTPDRGAPVRASGFRTDLRAPAV